MQSALILFVNLVIVGAYGLSVLLLDVCRYKGTHFFGRCYGGTWIRA